MMATIFHVYIDETIESTPRPFYVGKGTAERVKNIKRRNPYWKAIANKHGQQRRVFASFDNEKDAFLIEQALILKFGTFEKGPGGVWGANLTEGGEGVSGPKSEEWKIKVSTAMTGKPKSEEWKTKVSLALKGKPPSNKGKRLSEVTKAKMSATRKGKSLSKRQNKDCYLPA